MINQIKIALLAAALLPMTALATSWSTDTDASQIVFHYTVAGEPTQGIFTRFSADGSFEQSRPEAADLDLKIFTASIDLGDTIHNAFATSAEWFESKNHPVVEFSLTRLSPLGGTRYFAEGDLVIRGRRKTANLEIDLANDQGVMRARGVLVVARHDYWLGFGLSMAVVSIGPDVAVEFDLQARAN